MHFFSFLLFLVFRIDGCSFFGEKCMKFGIFLATIGCFCINFFIYSKLMIAAFFLREKNMKFGTILATVRCFAVVIIVVFCLFCFTLVKFRNKVFG